MWFFGCRNKWDIRRLLRSCIFKRLHTCGNHVFSVRTPFYLWADSTSQGTIAVGLLFKGAAKTTGIIRIPSPGTLLHLNGDAKTTGRIVSNLGIATRCLRPGTSPDLDEK